MNKKTLSLFFLTLFFVPFFALAVDPAINPFGHYDVATGNPIAEKSVTDIGASVLNLVNWFAWFISLVAVVMGLYSGFLFITARGETAQLATAKKTLLYAVIGIAVAVFSFSIIAVTKAFFL